MMDFKDIIHLKKKFISKNINEEGINCFWYKVIFIEIKNKINEIETKMIFSIIKWKKTSRIFQKLDVKS